MRRLFVLLAGVLVLGATPALAAPVCVLNRTGQTLLMVVDDLAGQRLAKPVAGGARLCLLAPKTARKAVVGVFADDSTEEGCSRLAHPGQPETLLDFAEFDNCKWADTNRVFD